MKRRKFLAAASRLAAIFALALCPGTLLAIDESHVVRGRVLGDGQPLAEVLVSDGCQIVRTDGRGEYVLPIGPSSGPFVFVTTPRGYWSDEFYVPADAAVKTGRADFRLRQVSQPDRFDFVFMADMHLERGGVGIAKLKSSIAEINRLEPAPAFLLAQGDICLQSGVGNDYQECLAGAKMPVRNGPGNHEMMLSHENPRDDFQRLFGPTYYSFDWGPVHVVVLDGNKPIPKETGWKAVHGAVEGSELLWLRADLAAQPKGKPIVVGVHIPVVSSYPERREQSPKDAPYWEMTNRELLTELLARHNVRLVLQGHMHENERTTVAGVEYVASISISGAWWKNGTGFERGVDNSPRGYRVVSVDGREISHRYQSSCESRVDRHGEFYGLEKPVKAGEQSTFLFNCYDAPNGATAQARIDGGPWLPMPAFPAPSPATAGLTMPHHFRLVTDTTGLPPGAHTVEARVTRPDKTVVAEEAEFLLAE